jgi:hypothetical protein
MFRVGLVTVLCMLAILTGLGGHSAPPGPTPRATPTPGQQNANVILTPNSEWAWRDSLVCGAGNGCAVSQQPIGSLH